MKKMLFLVIISGVLFGFKLNKTYSCETLGVNIKSGKKIISIPNSIKTYYQLKQSLKDLKRNFCRLGTVKKKLIKLNVQ